MNPRITELITSEHEGDRSQIDVIFSDAPKIMLEAPAGCGKTKTMISRLAYTLANDCIPVNKKILALTFSVNAAYKMKKDITEKLPLMGIDPISSPESLNKRVFITNYHGFSRRILSYYGYLLHPELPDINLFTAYNEETLVNLENEDFGLTFEDKTLLNTFSSAVKECCSEKIEALLDRYYELLITSIIPKRCVTFNGFLVLSIKLLEMQTSLTEFFQLLYPYIMIDEFQDTNYLSWKLVKSLISQTTRLFFMGDSLQRIYGFIGAIPDLLNIAKNEFSMEKFTLSKNYRFRTNPNMLLLDRNIRRNAENYLNPSIEEDSIVDLKLFDTQENETSYISSIVSNLLETQTEKVAILIQQRNPNANMILEQLEYNSINYFYGLFKDDDIQYISFHQNAIKAFFSVLDSARTKRVNKTLLNKVQNALISQYKNNVDKTIQSLITLTEAFFRKLLEEYNFLSNEEKIAYINDTLENRALRQSMDFVDSNVIVSTVHGAKGLEWNYVILPDMEPYIFPSYNSMCGTCDFRTGRIYAGDFCRMQTQNHSEKEIIEQLSVFYVAVTRARKEVLFTASKERYNAEGEVKNSYISCLLTIPGIVLR